MPILLALLILISPLGDGVARAEEIAVSKAAARSEDMDRTIDEVALASQENALSKLSTLVKKYEGKSQEPMLLSKLGELQQQKAAILFRVAHGLATSKHKPLDLTRYKKASQSTILTLTTLIHKYPSSEEIPKAFAIRGRSYEDIEDKKSAALDYEYLVAHFPDCEDAPAAYMSLAEFAIDANLHEKAIGYLKEVEKRPHDPHYPYALYKMAWSYYNLKRIPEALSYGERHLKTFADRLAERKAEKAEGDTGLLSTSDAALRENTLLDMTVFFFEGYEEGHSEYQLSKTLPYFRKLEMRAGLGKMLQRYAKLLRSHAHDADLDHWRDTVIAEESFRPESLEVVITTYEHQLNRRKYKDVIASAGDMVGLYKKHPKFEAFPKAQKLVLDTAEGLQQLILKNKKATEVRSYSEYLAQVYGAFTQMVAESDPRVPRAHYNLAETLFAIQDYPGATDNYRWVVDHPQKEPSAEISKIIATSALKAIASRYEVLHEKGLIPKALTPRALPKEDKEKIEPLLAEWVRWVDERLNVDSKGTENFAFEAARSLYEQGRVLDSIERLKRFAIRFPKSEFAIPSATLMVDTYIASGDWERTYEVAIDFMKVKEWKGSEFSKRLFAVAADSSYKLIEARSQSNDFRRVISLADEFLDNYSKSERLADALAIAGRAAVVLGDRDRATRYFSRIVKDAANSPVSGEAHLALAQMEEDRYEFALASSDLKSYLDGTPKAESDKLNAARKRLLTLAWLSGSWDALKTALEDKAVCVEKLAEDCERLHATYLIFNPMAASDEERAKAFDRAREKTGSLRAVWAALALDDSRKLAFRDRNLAVRFLASEYDSLDPLLKFALIPKISLSVPAALEASRKGIGEVAPLVAKEKYIKYRVDIIKEYEKAVTEAMKLPWARIKAESMNSLATAYLDFARGLGALPAPKGLSADEMTAYQDTLQKLSMPFEEKGQDIRAKAFQIASQSSIEHASFAAIADPFFTENPSQAKALKPATVPAEPPKLDLALLGKLDMKGNWQALDRTSGGRSPASAIPTDPSKRAKTLWLRSIQNGNLQQTAFFMQELQEKALILAGPMTLVHAVSLASAGAQGEALAILNDARSDLDPGARHIALTALVEYALSAYSKDRTKDFLHEIESDKLPSDPQLLLSAKNYVK